MIIYEKIVNQLEETMAIAELFVNQFLLKSNKIKLSTVVLYLVGSLGAGKTTFMRSVLHSLGFNGLVKSPTYTIVETYNELLLPVYHFDLYRLAKPKELEFIGIRDYLEDPGICCFEWPEKGGEFIPQADFKIDLTILSEFSRKIIISAVNNSHL